ncbi:MAG: TylF/MycF family methyltransferase [Silicimonas sp.]|nr:TylF/MycF family methyltransferase [Silicimonas sp.]
MKGTTETTPSDTLQVPGPQQLYKTFGHLSMMNRRRFVKNLKLAAAIKLPMADHAIVECGVWRGGASLAMLAQFPHCPEVHLFDSFEGLPEPDARDGERALRFSEEDLFVEGRNYADVEAVREEVARHGFDHRATLHKGWFEDTVHADKIDRPIGILRLDGDWYASTKVVLERLYDKVAVGGLIIVDDYFDWPGCSQAVHDFLSERKAPEVIRTHDALVAYLVKRPADALAKGPTEAELSKRRRAQNKA